MEQTNETREIETMTLEQFEFWVKGYATKQYLMENGLGEDLTESNILLLNRAGLLPLIEVSNGDKEESNDNNKEESKDGDEEKEGEEEGEEESNDASDASDASDPVLPLKHASPQFGKDNDGGNDGDDSSESDCPAKAPRLTKGLGPLGEFLQRYFTGSITGSINYSRRVFNNPTIVLRIEYTTILTLLGLLGSGLGMGRPVDTGENQKKDEDIYRVSEQRFTVNVLNNKIKSRDNDIKSLRSEIKDLNHKVELERVKAELEKRTAESERSKVKLLEDKIESLKRDNDVFKEIKALRKENENLQKKDITFKREIENLKKKMKEVQSQEAASDHASSISVKEEGDVGGSRRGRDTSINEGGETPREGGTLRRQLRNMFKGSKK